MGKKSDMLTNSPLFAECMALSDILLPFGRAMEDISLAVLFPDVVCCMTGGDVPDECVLAGRGSQLIYIYTCI